MDEYIRKVDAVDTVPKERIVEYMDEFGAGYNSCRNDMLRSMESLTPADVAPVVHGRWIKYTGMGKVQWMCSECSAEEKNPKVANYCYHCGAKMDEKGEK